MPSKLIKEVSHVLLGCVRMQSLVGGLLSLLVMHFLHQKGQHLEPFIQSFFNSCESPKPKPSRPELTILSPTSENDKKVRGSFSWSPHSPGHLLRCRASHQRLKILCFGIYLRWRAASHAF